ncbi:MAG: glycosyltransferase family 2 protein [Cyanobacteriota bacterium]|nr:glycosyltransferase family 2 protein [Cyanobacteriota bacterium]
MGLSVVTVCMNRRDHLLATAPRVAAWPHHREHLIVDWSSAVPLCRQDLPADPRLRLLRVEGETHWNLCRAYNFAFAQARGDRLLKLDADAWPTDALDPADPALRLPPLAGDVKGQGLLCAFGSGSEGRKGQFLIDHPLLDAVGGFNELLVGYGFDDKDLLARLLHWSGRRAKEIPEAAIGVIAHSDAERAELAAGREGLAASQGLAAMRATRLANRLVAAHCPWGPLSPRSQYLEEHPGVWRLQARSLPEPPAAVAQELEHVRRMTFWGHFLAIPEVFLEVLPFSLFPPAVGGRWAVRWWHRLWWHTGRRLLGLPVWLLVAGRERLVAGGRRDPGPR